ncbi:MAG: acyltransferase [Bacteroidetes bacterium]|nr:MAG: acyltransferase [Bacteroidota bacterium]GGH74437.1 acyltransferase [Phaeocystidibacter marisrubri]
MLVSPFIGKCGKNFTLAGGVVINGPQGLNVGDNVYFARGTWINAKAGIYIEDNVLFGPNVVISSAQHVFKDGSFASGQNIYRPITIGEGSWLAANVTVKCGVKLGKGNLVASNSSVVSDTPDYYLVAGVPAQPVKPVSERDGEAFTGVIPKRS